MKFAIIAAGEGSRLVQEGVSAPKPLVKVGGEHLIDRLIRVFVDCGASEICVICNEQMTAVAEHLQEIQAAGRVPLKYLVKSTPSSMHSAWELSRWLKDEPFVLTTVDTIFLEKEFRTYAKTFELLAEFGDLDGLMGVTDYIDDEKPLYVSINDARTITGFLDTCDDPQNISGGIYGLTPKAIPVLQRCIERGESRMRNFQRALVNEGLLLKAYSFSKVLDIDHASDIQKAEEFLKM